MKYLGRKSLSSLLHIFLQIAWYFFLLAGIFAIGFVAFLMFSSPVEVTTASEIARIKSEIFNNLKSQNEKAFDFFRNGPLPAKIIALLYMGAVTVLLLQIIKKGRQIFNNFQNNAVFNENNVQVLSKISKLLIAFSIITINFSTLLVSIVLLILADIFKNGTALQEEHDLTI